MHDGMPYGLNQGQGQGHSKEVDRQSPTGLIFVTYNFYYTLNSTLVYIYVACIVSVKCIVGRRN